MAVELVIPSSVPWADLKSADLEECLYWLLEDMGAKDLEWRKGGTGGGAADQGRDIEARFYSPAPDGEMLAQKWWVEAKGRSGTVDPLAVDKAIYNAFGRKEVDVLVIATNTQFSNPTRERVKQWQTENPRPKIRLWERTDLERMIVRHPSVAVRLFADALSDQGRVEVCRSRFWNHLQFASKKDLKAIWDKRVDLELSPESLFALSSSEAANGDLTRHPWMMIAEAKDLASGLAVGLLNLAHFTIKAEKLGADHAAIVRAAAYTLMTALARLPFDPVADLVSNVWQFSETEVELPPNVQRMLIQPVINEIGEQLANECVQRCTRITADSMRRTKPDPVSYWRRFRQPPPTAADHGQPPEDSLIIEKFTEPCAVGFSLDKDTHCPLFNWNEAADLRDLLAVFRRVIVTRVHEAGFTLSAGGNA